MNFAPPLKVLLLALLCVSGIVFLFRLGRVLLLILRAKRETAASSTFGKRLWRVFWEVLCQAKVIRQRPVIGVAHAFLLWGFVAFLPAEMDYLGSGFGHSFLNLNNMAGMFYSSLVFLFALCCAVSTVVLVARRYVARSAQWLDPASYQTAATLLLIFIVMATILPRYWLFGPAFGGNWLWWVHVVALLILVALLPGSKNLHALLSPFAIFFKREGFSHIPAPANRYDRGLVSGRDITRVTALQAFSCVECGRCTENCPAYNTEKELDPRLIPLGLSYYLDEFGPAHTAPILGQAISNEAIWQCTTCGACEDICPTGIQHLPMILGLRRAAFNSGTSADPNAAQLFANLSHYGNAAGFSESERDRFVTWLNVPIFDGTQEYCLWMGCMGTYDARGREIITSFIDIMQHLGKSFGVMRKEYCTGDAARRLGNDALVSRLAKVNQQLLQKAGAKKIVSICPHCVRTIAEDWNQMPGIAGEEDSGELDATIEHHSEFLARHAHLLPSKASGETVTYHDPCYLGRYRQVYDEPRRVIAQSAKLVEPPRTRDKSFCCGAGGGLVFLGPEKSQGINEARAAELTATGANVIATACPFCQSFLGEALPKDGTGPRLLDIAEIVAAGLRNPAQ